MKLPVQVVFRDLVPLPSLEGDIRRRAEKLAQFAPQLMSCHVAVEATANQHRQGHRYVVKIDVRVPAKEIFAGEHHGSEDIEVAVQGAFDAMGRRLEDYGRRKRGQVKRHQPGGLSADTGGAEAGEAAEK